MDLKIFYYEILLFNNSDEIVNFDSFIDNYYRDLKPKDYFPDGRIIYDDIEKREDSLLYNLSLKSNNMTGPKVKFKFTRIKQENPETTDGEKSTYYEFGDNEKGIPDHSYFYIVKKDDRSLILVATYSKDGPRTSQFKKYIREISNSNYYITIKPLIYPGYLEEVKALEDISIIELKIDLVAPFPEVLIDVDNTLFENLKNIWKRLSTSEIQEHENYESRITKSRHSLKLEISSDKTVLTGDQKNKLVDLAQNGLLPKGITIFKVSRYGNKKKIDLYKDSISDKVTILITDPLDQNERENKHFNALTSSYKRISKKYKI